MPLWSVFLDPLRVVLFALAHVCGGSLGGGIVVLSLGRLIQLPIGAGIYQTIAASARRAARFFLMGDLFKPDAVVASVAAGLAGAAVMAGPASTSSRTSAALAAAVTFLVAWRLSAQGRAVLGGVQRRRRRAIIAASARRCARADLTIGTTT
ncbi:MAG TPA: hypothetical protein VGH98_01180 [Gemmatimonadaceae bacterium]|jgi:hypothetical protein